jgi:DNA polymerase I-like protein with 3'-5' exonuclease and polymerase domains
MRYVHGQECDFYIVDTKESLDEATHILQAYDTAACDTEIEVTLPGGVFTDPYACDVRTIQLGFPDRDAIVIDRKKVEVRGTPFLDVLATKELVVHHATFDYKQMKVSLGVILNMLCSKVAMQSLALASGYKSGKMRGFTYQTLCRDFLGVRVDKTLQASNWGAPFLTDAQYEYAALDVGAPRDRAYKSLLLRGYDILRRESDRLGMSEVWHIRQALVPIVGDMELHGLLLDQDLLRELGEAVGEQVDSSTALLCEMLGLEVLPNLLMKPDGTWARVKTPAPKSTKLLNHKAGLLAHINKALKGYGVQLADLKEDTLKPHTKIPVIGALAQYAMYHKLLGDIEKYQRVSNTITGYVHFQTNIIGTSSGRMSGSSDEDAKDKLSVQQMSGKKIALKGGREVSIRSCVKAKAGTVILDLDFASQELRIAAALSQDKVMLDTYLLERDNPYLIHPETGNRYKNPMTDLHLVATLSMIPYAYLKELPLWEVLAASKVVEADGKCPRDKGKTFNFSVVYGASAVSVAEDLGVSQKEAEAFLKAYFDNFSGLKRWMDKQSKTANDLRWLQLPMGAQVFVNEANAKGSGDKGAIARRAGNIPIQGTGAIMMALALKYQRERLGDRVHLLAAIYDGVLLEIPIPKGEYDRDDAGNWSPYVISVAHEAKQCLLDAEGDILSPYIGQPFPCGADSKLSMYWSH